MKLKLLFFGLLFFSVSVSAQVCNSIRAIDGFSSASLFDKAIINGKPLDYYTFTSTCNIKCLTSRLKQKNIQYSFKNNLSVYDNKSVATIVLEGRDPNYISGYLTCSISEKRYYIKIPLRYQKAKVSLDLQTEDHINIARILNFQSYSKIGYLSIIKQVESLSINRLRVVGFYQYTPHPKYGINNIKISDITTNGDFMIIVEKRK